MQSRLGRGEEGDGEGRRGAGTNVAEFFVFVADGQLDCVVANLVWITV